MDPNSFVKKKIVREIVGMIHGYSKNSIAENSNRTQNLCILFSLMHNTDLTDFIFDFIAINIHIL